MYIYIYIYILPENPSSWTSSSFTQIDGGKERQIVEVLIIACRPLEIELVLSQRLARDSLVLCWIAWAPSSS